MDENQNPSAEALALRRCIRDMVALSGLPAVWIGLSPRQIIENLADAMRHLLALDFAYVRLDSRDGAGVEVCCTDAGAATTEQTQSLATALELRRLTAAGDLASEAAIANPFTDGILQMAVARFGHPGESGIVVAGSRRPDFPTETDRLLLGVGTNQTAIVLARKCAEEALRDSEARFRSIANIAPAVLWTASADGTITFASDRWYAYTGLTPEQNALDWPQWVLHPDDFHRCAQAWEAALRYGLEYEIEVRNRRHDGEYRWWITRATPIKNADGQVAEWIGSSTDIHELKRAQQALQESQRHLRRAKETAEAASRAKNEFLANVSHEFRTPMTAILGMLRLALNEDLAGVTRDYLQTAADSAETLMFLLNDILDLSRMEAGHFELEPALFNPRGILDETIKTLSIKAREKGLALACHVHPSVPDLLWGDGRRLRQVFVNLVGNAIKFTEHGAVVVEVETEVQPPPAPPGPGTQNTRRSITLHLAVRDTGVGISAQDQEHIFQPFTQVDASFARRQSGTGLGLSICSELINRMGGRIWVESEIGVGSRFHCTAQFALPEDAAEAARRPSGTTAAETTRRSADGAAGQPPAARPLHVLLAEDTRANQKLVSAILSKRGHRLTIVQNGHEALEAVRQGEFDVLVMDVQMPVMDGYQATAALRAMEQEDKAHMPIVAMTAHAMRGDRERCLAAGMDAYIAKPIDADDLVRQVEELAASPRRPSSCDNVAAPKSAKE